MLLGEAGGFLGGWWGGEHGWVVGDLFLGGELEGGGAVVGFAWPQDSGGEVGMVGAVWVMLSF